MYKLVTFHFFFFILVVSFFVYSPFVDGLLPPTEAFLSAAPSIAAVSPQRRSIPSPLQSVNPTYESSILLQWWLPVSFLDFYRTTLPSFYEIAYQSYDGINNDIWYTAVNVTGYNLEAPYGLREVQRILFRSSDLGMTNEVDYIYFRLTVQDTTYSNFDRERHLITPRLPYNISAYDLEEELNKLDPIRLTYGPVHVERDTSAGDNHYQWRITFTASKETVPLPVPLLYITEQYAPSTTAIDTAFTVDRVNRGRGITDDQRSGCVATSPDDKVNICQHSLIGLLPGIEYRFRIRAYIDRQFSEYSLPSEKVMFPRTIADSIVVSSIASPLLSSLSDNSVTLLVQLPYSRNDNQQVTPDSKPMVRMQVQVAKLTTKHSNDTSEEYRWQTVNGIVDKRTNIISTRKYVSSSSQNDNNNPSPFTVATTVTVNNLDSGSLYAFRIRGIVIPRDDTGYTNTETTTSPSLSTNRLSIWSNPLTNIQTLPAVPVPPTVLPLQRTDINHDSVILRWYYPQNIHSETSVLSYQSSFIPNTRIIGYRVQYRQISSSLLKSKQRQQSRISSDRSFTQWVTYSLPQLFDGLHNYWLNETSSVYRITCNISTENGKNILEWNVPRISQTMIQSLANLRKEKIDVTVIAATNEDIQNQYLKEQNKEETEDSKYKLSSSSSSCQYTLRLSNLVPLAMYEIQIVTLQEIIPFASVAEPSNRNLQIEEIETYAFSIEEGSIVPTKINHRYRTSPPSPASSRIRTRGLPRSTLPDTLRTETNIPEQAQIPLRGTGTGLRSTDNLHRLLNQIPNVPFICNNHGASNPTAYYQIISSTNKDAPGKDDPEYVPRIAEGGSAQNTQGGNGMIVVSLYTEGGEEPIETITYRYPHSDAETYPTAPKFSSSSVLHRTVLLQPFDGNEEQDPRTYIYRVPGSRTGSGESPDITRVQVRAWGAGGGCGTRILHNNGTLDDGTYLYRHPTNTDIQNILPSVCVPGGTGTFIRAWLRVQPGHQLIIFPGTGGKAGFASSAPSSSSSSTLGQAGWPGGGSGGKGRKSGGGGGGASIVYVVPGNDGILKDVSTLSSLSEQLFIHRIPTILASGGGGGGASDYSTPTGGNGGGCNGYDGDSPLLSPKPLTLELSNPNITIDEHNRTITLREFTTGENGTVPWDNTYDPLVGIQAVPYQEHSDMGFMPENNYVLRANGGKGGHLLTRTGGNAGRSGSLYISGSANSYGTGKDTSLSTDGTGPSDWVMNKEGSVYQPSSVISPVRGLVTVPASAGRWLFGGNGGSGWEGGGGGGAGLFAGGGGGSGIDGSGGGGGTSYIDSTYVLNIPEPIPRPLLTLLSVNSVSVMFAWLPIVWPGISASSIVQPLSSFTVGIEAREYIIERTIGLYDDNFVQVWNGPGSELLRHYVPTETLTVEALFATPVAPLYTILTHLVPNIIYRFRIYGIHPKGNTSLLSEPIIVTTPNYRYNQWKVIQGLPTVDERTGPSTVNYDTSYPQTPLPPPLRGASTTVIDGYIYIFGGLSPGYDCGYGPLALACPGHSTVRNETWRLDPTSWSWYQLPISPLLTPPARERHTAVNIDNRLYILGGRSHPDVTRNGGPYLEDMWVLELGYDNEVKRTSMHTAVTMVPDTLSGISIHTNADHFSLSCEKTNSTQRTNTTLLSFDNPLGQVCGLPELIEPILTLQVQEDREFKLINSTISWNTSGETVITVPDDSCVDTVEVWIELVHPCLQDIEIRLIGPGPQAVRSPLPSTHDVAHDVHSGNLNNFYNGNANTTNYTHPLKLLGPERVTLYRGGNGQGSAASSWYCNSSSPSSKISSAYFHNSGKATFGLDASNFEDITVPHHDIITSLLHDRLVVFDDQALASTTTCCDWQNANNILPSFRTYKALNASIQDLLQTYAKEVLQELSPEDDTVTHIENERFYQDELRYNPFRISFLEGHYKPVDSLHVFHGTRAKGQWGLQVIDRVQNNITGEVRRWGLVLRTVPCQKQYVWSRLYPPPPNENSTVTNDNQTSIKPIPSRFIQSLPSLSRIPPVRIDASSVVIGTSLFIWGGQGEESYTLPDGKDLWRYDALMNNWILLHPSVRYLSKVSDPLLFSSQFYEDYLRKEQIIGTGMQQYGVLTSIGLIAWGGLPHSTVSQFVEETLPGYPLHAQGDECINSRGTWNGHNDDTGGAYACTNYALLTTVWDFQEQRWRRLHPSMPLSSMFRKTNIHSYMFETPPHLRYTSLNIIGDSGMRNRVRGVTGPTLFVIGGAEVMSGTIQDMRIWTLLVNETTALGDPYPPIDTPPNNNIYSGRDYAQIKSQKWKDLCTPLLIPDSPSYTNWYSRCLRPEYRSDGSVALPPSHMICTLETILLRAWCEGEYQTIGMI